MMQLLFRIRCWIIRLLAGRDHIAINLIVGKDGSAFTVPYDRRLFSANCDISSSDRAIHVSSRPLKADAKE